MDFATSLLNLILASTISLLVFGLGIVVFLENKHSWINKSFGIFSLGATIWILSAYLSDLPQLATFSLYFNRLIFAGLSLMLTGFFHFCFVFSNKKETPKFFLSFIYSIGAILVFLSSFTPLIIKGVVFKEWGTDLIIGSLFPFFIGFSLICSLGIVKIFLEYRKTVGLRKIQIQYLFLGLFLFTSINIFIHILLFAIIGSREFYQIGNYSTLFVVGFTAYAIVTRQLFDIKVILTEVLVAIMGLILFIQAIVAPSLVMKILNGGIFFLFCLFGYFLIKSVINEIGFRKKLELAYQEVEKLSKAKSEFISIASHQIRTPLAAIKGYISMILEGSYGKLVDRAKTPLENVYKSNERLINLVNDLLCISRIESGKVELKLEKSSIEEIIMGVVDDLMITAEKKKLYLKLEKPTEPLPKIMLDKDKMRQAILNLVDNAIKYTLKGGITINIKIIDSRFQILIRDTGGGMSKEDLVKLFESFSRGIVGSQSYTGGSGLGLYIARRFVEMHNGRIWAESDGIDKGSSFFIELPVN